MLPNLQTSLQTPHPTQRVLFILEYPLRFSPSPRSSSVNFTYSRAGHPVLIHDLHPLQTSWSIIRGLSERIRSAFKRAHGASAIIRDGSLASSSSDITFSISATS